MKVNEFFFYLDNIGDGRLWEVTAGKHFSGVSKTDKILLYFSKVLTNSADM